MGQGWGRIGAVFSNKNCAFSSVVRQGVDFHNFYSYIHKSVGKSRSTFGRPISNTYIGVLCISEIIEYIKTSRKLQGK